MNKHLIASVFVEKTTLQFDKKFSYSIPFDFADKVFVGQRVLVPFGNGNKKRQGVITEINSTENRDEKLKPIFELVDEKPLVTDEMMKLASFISDRTFCTFYEGLRPMIPIGVNVKVVTSYVLKKD